MVPVAPTLEVVGGLKVCDDGFYAGAPGGAEDAEDSSVRFEYIPDDSLFLTDFFREISLSLCLQILILLIITIITPLL